jgi:glucan phosphoethanolaminetransferase (alkaline phosphatase superfamily)
MIQRIQTVYLLIVSGLFTALLFLPLAIISSGALTYSFEVDGLKTTTTSAEMAYSTWSLFALAALIALLSIVIIFSYKKRIRQLRICVFNTFLIIGFCALVAFYLWQFKNSPDLPDCKVFLRFWTAFPLVALIFNYLAIRNIGADEAMIRSLERLR